MSIAKNFYDKSVPTRNLWTTIPGIITLVLSILVGFNVISLDQSTELNAHAVTLTEAITAIVGVVQAIILMFKAKDA